MKSFVSLFILITFSLTSLFSQNNKFHVGIGGGPSISSIRGFDQIVPLSPIIGFSLGASFQYDFSKHFSIVTGVGFEQKGFQTKEKVTLIDINGNSISEHILRVNYNYLDVPLLAKYTLGSQKFKGFMNLGGYMGILINRRNILVGYDPQTDEQKENSEEVQPFDFGLSAGIGMSYSLSETFVFTLEVRNNLGLYNVSKTPIINDGTNNLNSTNLLIGLNYGFGK